MTSPTPRPRRGGRRAKTAEAQPQATPPAPKPAPKAPEVVHSSASFTKITTTGQRVISDHLLPGEVRVVPVR